MQVMNIRHIKQICDRTRAKHKNKKEKEYYINTADTDSRKDLRDWIIQTASASVKRIQAQDEDELQVKIENILGVPIHDQILSKGKDKTPSQWEGATIINLSRKSYWTEVEWAIPIRKRNKKHHALHGNGMTKEEIQAKEEELVNNIMTAVKAHPTYHGKPLGNLIKWIKQLAGTKQFRDQCATPENKKTQQLAQYAIAQAQWISTQEGNAWSLKAAQERANAKGKGKGKGKENDSTEEKGKKGKTKGKGKGKERGVPWGQLSFQPIEFEMYQEGDVVETMTDEDNKPKKNWVRPTRILKEQFVEGATGLGFLTMHEFAEKAAIALSQQKAALAALVPTTLSNMKRQHPHIFDNEYEQHDWRPQEITLTVFSDDLPELKSATMMQFGRYEVVSSQIQPDITFAPSDKIEVIVIWELEKYPTQPTKEEMKEAIEKITATPLAETYACGQALNRATNKQYGWQCICKMLPKTADILIRASGKADIYSKYFTRQGATPTVEMTPVSFPPSVTKQEVYQLASVQKGWQGIIHNERGYAARIDNTHLAESRLKLRGPSAKYPDPRIDAETTKVLGKYKYRIQGAQTGSDALEVPNALRGWGKWETRVENMWVYKGSTCANIVADQPPPHNAPTAYPRTAEGKTYPVVITPLNQLAKDVLLTPRRQASVSPRPQNTTPNGSQWLRNGSKVEPPQFGMPEESVASGQQPKSSVGSQEGSPQSLGSPASFSTEVSGEGIRETKESKDIGKTSDKEAAPMGPAIERLRQVEVENQLRKEIEEGKKNAMEQEKDIKAWVKQQLEEVKKQGDETAKDITAVQQNVQSLSQGQEDIKQSIALQSRELAQVLQQGFAMMAGIRTGPQVPPLTLENLNQGAQFQFGLPQQQLLGGASSSSAQQGVIGNQEQARLQEEERKRREAEHAARLQLQIQNEAKRVEEEARKKEEEEQRRVLDKLAKQEENRKEEENKQKKEEEAEAKERERKAIEAARGNNQSTVGRPEVRGPPDTATGDASTRDHSRSPPGRAKPGKKEGAEPTKENS